jgi:glycerol-3-phosphate acyltransferase PlsY
MLKAAIPALIFRLWQPQSPAYLVAAAMSTVGHNWPLYYGFKGGRGMSPILGGMLVVDWLGVVVTQLVGMLIGWPLKRTILAIGGGIALMAPWVWFRHHDGVQLVYVVAMNVIFWGAMAPELREYYRLKREGSLETFSDAAQIRVVGRRGEETVDRLSFSNLLSRRASKAEEPPES